MAKEDPEHLHRYQQRRDRLLHEHEQLLERLRNRPADMPREAIPGEHQLLARLKEIQSLVDVQGRKIEDLLRVEANYRELSRQFDSLESTNQKLIQQLLLFSDADERRKAMEALVVTQREELVQARARLREAQLQIETLRMQAMQMQAANASLAERMEDYRMRLDHLLEREAEGARNLEKVRAELHKRRKSYETLQRRYQKLQTEYETMYCHK